MALPPAAPLIAPTPPPARVPIGPKMLPTAAPAMAPAVPPPASPIGCAPCAPVIGSRLASGWFFRLVMASVSFFVLGVFGEVLHSSAHDSSRVLVARYK